MLRSSHPNAEWRVLAHHCLEPIRDLELLCEERGADPRRLLSGEKLTGTGRAVRRVQTALARYQASTLQAQPLSLRDVYDRLHAPVSNTTTDGDARPKAAATIRWGSNLDYPTAKTLSRQGTNRAWVHTAPERFKSGGRFQPAQQNLSLIASCPRDQTDIGYARFYHRKDGATTLHEIAVDPDRQSTGVGRALIGAVMAQARARGQYEIVCKVPRGEPEGFYRRVGFQIDTEATRRDEESARRRGARPVSWNCYRLELAHREIPPNELGQLPDWFNACIDVAHGTPDDRVLRYAQVCSALRSSFRYATDALHDAWVYRNLTSGVDSTGYCYPAVEAAYHLLGGKRAGLTSYVVPGWSHWFLKDSYGTRIDPSADQFGETPVPYETSRGCGLLTLKPSVRGRVLLTEAKRVLRVADEAKL
ncbi:MAG: GNAT family N-acetyltransferase [Myxococcota bacterium]